jgi:hypothetical protein
MNDFKLTPSGLSARCADPEARRHALGPPNMSTLLSTLRAMILLSVALTLLRGGASASALPKSQTAAAEEIAMIGSFLGDGPWSRWGGGWLSLLERENGFELREVIVSSTRETPICGDVGFNVRGADAKPGILLLRGFSGVKAGPVVAAFNGGRFGRFLRPGERLGLSLGGENSWSLHAFGTVRPVVGAAGGEARITDYQVQMIGRGRTDVVFSLDVIDNDAPPSILWAGDLDADGVVDLFADLPTHYAGHHYVLFLSSVARAGQFVAEAASLTTVGC